MAPLNYTVMTRAKTYPVTWDIINQIKARELHHSAIAAADQSYNIIFNIINREHDPENLEPKLDAALDFISCAKKLLSRNATFNYDNPSRTVVYTLPGQQANYRVLKGQLWDEVCNQQTSNFIHPVSGQHQVPIPSIPLPVSPLKGDAKPFTPATTPATTPSTSTSASDSTCSISGCNPEKTVFHEVGNQMIAVWDPTSSNDATSYEELCKRHRVLTPLPSPPTSYAPIRTLHAPYRLRAVDSNGKVSRVWDWKLVPIKGLKLKNAFAHVPSSTIANIQSTDIKQFWQHTNRACNLDSEASYDAEFTFDYRRPFATLADCKQEQERRHLEAAYSYAITQEFLNLFDCTHEFIFDKYRTEFMSRNNEINDIDAVLKTFRDQYMEHANGTPHLRHLLDTQLDLRWAKMLQELHDLMIAKEVDFVEDIATENKEALAVQTQEVNTKVMEAKKKQEEEDREIERKVAAMNFN